MVHRDEVLTTRRKIDEALSGLPDCRYRLGVLVTFYKTPTAACALELIAGVGRLAKEKNHNPDVEWRYNRSSQQLRTHTRHGQLECRVYLAAP